MDFWQELNERHLVENITSQELIPLLKGRGLTFYAGFDPTAPSLQLGNLFQALTMRRLQRQGHRPLCVMGGATGMIGDPSGKSDERSLLDAEQLQSNLAGQRSQLERFLDFEAGPCQARMLNNADWMGSFSFLDFLRVIGKRFRLADMLAKESVKQRLDSAAGISFTEFSYQMIQAYDFAYLAENFGVQLQLGGGDQWGNITAGIDLTRKLHGKTVYGLVTPLVTDSQGRKFGKSQAGAIYLDPGLTSPYQMYQYLLNVDDGTVMQLLHYFSFRPLEELKSLADQLTEAPHLRAPQQALAAELVELVHGEQQLRQVQAASRIFFGEKIANLSDEDLRGIFADVPAITLPRVELEQGIAVLDLLEQTPLFKSRGEAKRSLQQKGVYLNNEGLEGIERLTSEHLASQGALVLRKGKKNYCLVIFR